MYPEKSLPPLAQNHYHHIQFAADTSNIWPYCWHKESQNGLLLLFIINIVSLVCMVCNKTDCSVASTSTVTGAKMICCALWQLLQRPFYKEKKVKCTKLHMHQKLPHKRCICMCYEWTPMACSQDCTMEFWVIKHMDCSRIVTFHYTKYKISLILSEVKTYPCSIETFCHQLEVALKTLIPQEWSMGPLLDWQAWKL